MSEEKRVSLALIVVAVSTVIGAASGALGISILGGLVLSVLIWNAKA